MTKATEIVTPWAGSYPDYILAYNQKLADLQAQGKTDGVLERPNDITFIRFWVDQAAAEEWINWVATNLAVYGLAYNSAVIRDI